MASTIWAYVSWFIKSIGYYKILKKCGGKPILGIVPVVREYQISRCADREKEGRTFARLAACQILAELFMYIFMEEGSRLYTIGAVLVFALTIATILYQVRIYNGLCQTFERSKKWLWLWFFFEPFIAILWGFSDKFSPKKKLAVIDEDAAAKESGIVVKSIDEGLTVNIKDRTAIDFFKKKYLLKDIHLNVPKGHMVLLLGGSGAGKTTFVNAVTGYEKADASIILNEKNLYSEYKKMKYDVGFVPQADLMRGNDTVYRTLADAATLRLPSGITVLQRKKRVHEVLEEFGLGAIQHSLVEKLSGGQRKRLSIAMEFISDPSLFILDEPDSGLDGVVARGLFEKLRSIADSGKIVIVITHTPDRVIDLFDDVIVLAKDATRTGRLAYYGPVKEAYDFFGKDSMEDILLSINQKEEGGEGRADEFVEKYADMK
ncbi:MAG: ABC transporter ATP-binding protein, partial [Lachnospiraceae bacterium]|nr:ABC transporter ATP-binding protein [Lachnospiraceae bacterium]